MSAGVTVRTETMCDFFTKFHLEGLKRAAVVHRFTAPDHGDPHDHPWSFTSLIVSGGYVEEVFALNGSSHLVHRKPGESFQIAARHIHRIVDLPEGEYESLILPGPHEQTPGFWQFREDGAWRRDWNGEWRPVSAGQARAA